MISIKTRRKAVAAVFGDKYPIEDTSQVDWLFERRGCAVFPERGWFDLQYVKDWDEQDTAIRNMLDAIAKRDGKKIAAEVADRLIEGIEITRSLL